MLIRRNNDTFEVDFSLTPRSDALRVFGLALPNLRRAPVEVDGWAIGQAVKASLAFCTRRTVRGTREVWNEYRLFLARADLDGLRPAAARLNADLDALLRAEISALGGETVGTVEIRLLADEGGEVESGRGVLRVGLRADDAPVARAEGEVTVRFAVGAPVGPSAEQTLRQGLRARTSAGVVGIREGTTLILGRGMIDPGPDYVKLPGASTKISRRHATIRVDGDEVEVARETGANPVALAGRGLADGESTRVRLPAELVLAGELTVVIERC